MDRRDCPCFRRAADLFSVFVGARRGDGIPAPRKERIMADENCAENTDFEIWRKVPDDFYAPSIHSTKDRGGITISVGGTCITMPVEEWHRLAMKHGNLSNA